MLRALRPFHRDARQTHTLAEVDLNRRATGKSLPAPTALFRQVANPGLGNAIPVLNAGVWSRTVGSQVSISRRAGGSACRV